MPVLRFHLIDLYYSMVEGGFIVTCTTNAACHLYLRYSGNFPFIHRKPVSRRGLVMGWDARYCFTAYHHIEQNEPGDVWTHTFTWPGWKNCERRYFYFWGTMGGQDMVSDTPIFWLHYLEEEIPPFVYFYPDPHPEVTSIDGWVRESTPEPTPAWENVRDGPGSSVGTSGLYSQLGIYSGGNDAEWMSIYRSILLFDTSTIGPGKTIHAAELRLTCVTVNIVPEWPSSAVVVVSSLPARNMALVKEDYITLGDIAFSNTIPFSSFSAGADQTLVLNAAGLLAIDPEGITKLGLREHAYDRANIAPPWARLKYLWLRPGSAEQADILHRPRLGVSFS